MVYVEGGTFWMGDGSEDDNSSHEVTVSSYMIGKYPVTQKEWKKVMGDNPSYYKGKNNLVEQITWFNCVEFCNRLSRKEGLEECYKINGKDVRMLPNKNGYRLPTEAEWEFAARGGNDSNDYEYLGSDDIDDVAWHEDNSNDETHSVGELEPNELDIYDMSGNVWEWCWDWYDADYYNNSSNNDPKGPSSGSNRVNRGGSYFNVARYCRSANRGSNAPSYSFDSIGLRLVRCP